MVPRWLFRVVAFLLMPVLLVSSCGWPPMTRHLHSSSELREISRLTSRDAFLKAHLRDGGVCLFTQWSVEETSRSVTGQGWRFDAGRKLLLEGPVSAPLDSIVLFESNQAPERLHPAIKALLIVVGVTALVAVTAVAALAACGKSCTGSCPTFYVWDGEHYVLSAEGFSASVSPSLEATDVDALFAARPMGPEFEVVMLNEALETHVVRSVELLAAPRADEGRVFAVPGGGFVQGDGLVGPRRAMAAEGDCAAALQALDGRERFSRTDSTDLAARETIELEFDASPGAPAGLVIGSRQTLVTTFLFYQSLAWMGRSAGDWIASLENSGPGIRKRASGVGKALGGIQVQVHDEKRGWVDAGEIFETGPIATDVRLLPLPAVDGGDRRVRLRMARGLWRLDYVALARVGAPVVPIRLDPVRVLRHDAPDDSSRARLVDPDRALTTLPGDRYTLIYRLPQDSQHYELFLESRGYYLEWIRDEWLAEEDPARVISMFMNPRGTLRRLAPAFKRQEARQEAQFWEVTRGHL